MIYGGRMRLFGALVILIFALAHLPFITAEPTDHHSWRQVTTAGVARAFYTESSDIFHPRIFDREDKSGITGMEFPIFNYIVFVFIKLFGYANWHGRLISLLFSAAGLFWFWRLAALELGETAGLFSLIALSSSPLYFYFSRNIQPDIPMLSLLIGSFYFIEIWRLERKRLYFWLACLAFTSAAMMKLPAIAFLPFFVFIMYSESGKQSSAHVAHYVFMTITVAIVAGWYLYSSHLVKEYGLKYFYLGGDLQQSLSFLMDWRFYRTVFVNRLPEIVTNYALFPFLVAGIVFYKRIAFPRPVIVLIIVLALYYAIGGFHLYIHDYYSLPAAPIAAVLAGGGIWHVMRNAGRSGRTGAIILLAIAPVVMAFRVAPWYRGVFPDFPKAKALVGRYVPSESRMVAAWRTDPTLLFFTFRNGWAMPPQNVDKNTLYEQGARFLITTTAVDSLIPERETLRFLAQDATLRLYAISEDTRPNSGGKEGRAW